MVELLIESIYFMTLQSNLPPYLTSEWPGQWCAWPGTLVSMHKDPCSPHFLFILSSKVFRKAKKVTHTKHIRVQSHCGEPGGAILQAPVGTGAPCVLGRAFPSLRYGNRKGQNGFPWWHCFLLLSYVWEYFYMTSHHPRTQPLSVLQWVNSCSLLHVHTWVRGLF